jgi:hypothetical protein
LYLGLLDLFRVILIPPKFRYVIVYIYN